MTPRADDLRLRDARDGRRAATPRRSARHEVPRPTSPARSPASASTRRPPTPARTSAACGRPAARCWPRRRSAARRRPAGSTSCSRAPVAITPGTTYVASLLRAQRPLLGDRRRASPRAVDNPPLHALANAHERQRRVRLRLVERVPDEHLQRRQLLGRRAVRAGAPRPGTPTGVTATAGSASASVVLDRAVQRRPARPPTRSRRTSARRRRRRRP